MVQPFGSNKNIYKDLYLYIYYEPNLYLYFKLSFLILVENLLSQQKFVCTDDSLMFFTLHFLRFTFTLRFTLNCPQAIFTKNKNLLIQASFFIYFYLMSLAAIVNKKWLLINSPIFRIYLVYIYIFISCLNNVRLCYCPNICTCMGVSVYNILN